MGDERTGAAETTPRRRARTPQPQAQQGRQRKRKSEPKESPVTKKRKPSGSDKEQPERVLDWMTDADEIIRICEAEKAAKRNASDATRRAAERATDTEEATCPLQGTTRPQARSNKQRRASTSADTPHTASDRTSNSAHQAAGLDELNRPLDWMTDADNIIRRSREAK